MGQAKREKLRIFLLRHGKPAFPDERSYIYGHTDYPLAAVGIEQAEKIAAALAGVPMGRIVSSDLARAAQTADIVASFQTGGTCEPERDPALREIDMGEWDGRAKDEIEGEYVDVFRMRGEDFANTAAPGGESFVQLQRRALGALERIVRGCEGTDSILLVAHGGLFWSMISGLFRIPLGDMMRFGLDYCALHLVECDRATGAYKLIRYNWSPDLTDYMDYPI
ncbi:histidine phosphatase family protein [Synergistaceae bacterium OttesenSCG-928-I11]|nr:histidine phosphatase family protein [Synergistaceae bacterium OttesenSCG-928-I11]